MLLRRDDQRRRGFGGDFGEIRCGPDQGYIWAVTLLVVEGLTAGTPPALGDIVNIYRNGPAVQGQTVPQGKLFWQLNGDTFFEDFGRGAQILFPGDALYVASVGTLASTSQITLSGIACEVAAERMGELF